MVDEPENTEPEVEGDKELTEEEADDATAEEGGHRVEQDKDVVSDPDEQGVPGTSTR